MKIRKIITVFSVVASLVAYSQDEPQQSTPQQEENQSADSQQDDDLQQSEEPLPEPIHYDPTFTVPVFYVNTADFEPIVSKEEYLKATGYITVPDGSQYEALASVDKPIEMDIRGRGNASWINFDKKPYKIKMSKKNAVLGMPKSKHWALMAYAADHLDYLNDAAAYELGRLMGTMWQPRLRPVELVLNGEYRGLYMIQENIRVDKDRINIYEQKDKETDPELVTGGWLLEIDNYYDDAQIRVYKPDNSYIRFTYKSPEELSDVQLDWLTTEMQQIVDMIYLDSRESESWAEKVDVESLAKYFIIRELFDDTDAFNGSCYLYKDLADDAKWTFGTMWDVSNSWRDKTDFTVNMPVGYPCSFHIIESAQTFDIFAEAVKHVWEETYPDTLNQLYEYITDFMAPIAEADKRNGQMWGYADFIDADFKANDLISVLKKNAEWMNNNYLTLPRERISGIRNEAFISSDSDIEPMKLKVRNGQIEISVNGRLGNIAPCVFTTSGTMITITQMANGKWVAVTPNSGIYLIRVGHYVNKVVIK